MRTMAFRSMMTWKERYAIQRTNRFNRNPTEADKMHDYLEWKEIVTALKKQGYDKITVGVDEKGEEIIQPLKRKDKRNSRCGYGN